MRVLLPLLGAAAGFAITPPAALAASGNAAATQAYLQANYALVRVARAHLAAAEAGPVHVLDKVQSECPRVGAGSPQNSESTQMSYQVVGAMVIAAAQPDLQAINAYIHVVAGLSWSSHALTSAVRSYVGDLKTILSLAAPNLCGEVKAWSADGFHALPASTVAFVGKFERSWVAFGFVPTQLKQYESASGKALAQRSEPLETLLTEGEARAVEHYREIMNVLEINP